MQANQIFRVLIQLRLLRRQTLDRKMSPKPIRFANLMLCCLLLSMVKNQRFARTFHLQFPTKFHDINGCDRDGGAVLRPHETGNYSVRDKNVRIDISLIQSTVRCMLQLNRVFNVVHTQIYLSKISLYLYLSILIICLY